MPRPCMVLQSGVTDYYLDPNDYTKKEDGKSDITLVQNTINDSTTELQIEAIEKEYFDYAVEHSAEKDRSKILVIGDSMSSDILGGINSGIDTCWYNPKNENPQYESTFEISDIKDLQKIL